MADAIPLPDPWDYRYEWNGPFGTRKFSTASHNGNRPDRSVPIYTADQMHAHAAAVSAAKDAEIAALQIKADLLDLAVRKGLLSVHSELIDPRNHGTRCSWLEGHAKACDISNNARAALAARKGEATTPPPSPSPRS